MIVINNLTKYYGDQCILDHINLNINKGEIYGLIGESGVGKSTLLSCINRLEEFQEGSVVIDGVPMENLNYTELRKIRKNIGMIFQGFSLLQRKTVYQNIALPMECWKENPNTIKNRVLELAEIVGIKDKLDSKPSELSGGQKQRVAIARALTQNPKILLCDECTSSLDPANTSSVVELLANLRKKFSITIVIVTHEMSIIQKLCDRVSLLHNGKIIETVSVDNLFMKKTALLDRFNTKTISKRPHSTIDLILSGTLDDKTKALMYHVGKITKKEYSILDSEFIPTNHSVVFHYVIRIDSEDLDAVSSYLSENQISFRTVQNQEALC